MIPNFNCDRMALQIVLSRWNVFSPSSRINISRISCDSDWSTIELYPEFPNKFKAKSVHHVECSGDGLVCFCNDRYMRDPRFTRDNNYLIWNPSTGKFQLIPPLDFAYLPSCCSDRRCIRTVDSETCGLGFVPESHDFKFLRFMSSHYKVRHEPCPRCRSSEHVAVYSSKTNSWKELPFHFDCKDSVPFEVTSQAATCVNGFLYWKTSTDVILSFHLSSDKFSTFPFPDDIARQVGLKGEFLLELDGSLCLVMESRLEKTKKNKLFSFWVYEYEASSTWTRKINFDVRLDAAVAEKPLWLGKKNNGGQYSLLLQGYEGSLLEYDYTARELKKIDQIDDHRRSKMMISSYVETNAKKKIKSTREFDGWKAPLPLRPHSKRGNNVVVDRISQLPDDIIIRILSFLSLKEAASTSVLSTRWLDLWRHIPNLIFLVTHFKRYEPKFTDPLLRDTHFKRYKPRYIKWVNSVVESHKALSLKEFHISFPVDYSTRRRVTKWLEFAFSRRVEVLELNLFGRRFAFFQKFMRKSSVLQSSNLRSLCLKCLEVSGEAIGLFLRNCPLLERLIIGHAFLTSDLEVCGSALKHLDIRHCKGGKSIKGYAPNLTCLKIDSCPFIIDPYDYHEEYERSPLCFISSPLTTLEFTLHCPPKDFEKQFPHMPTLRELIVTYLECGHCISPITCLIRAVPYLEEFEIKFFSRNRHTTGSLIEQKGIEAVNNVERYCHWHLKVLRFTWFDVGDGDHMELMSYILDNCVALQKIIIDTYDANSHSYVAVGLYAKQLRSKLPTHIQLIINFNNCQLV